jgi:hypothetical protein
MTTSTLTLITEMTTISFTSGELYDIISALQLVEEGVYDDGDLQGAAYYQNMIQQFELISNKLQEFVPEDRVANLALVAN